MITTQWLHTYLDQEFWESRSHIPDYKIAEDLGVSPSQLRTVRKGTGMRRDVIGMLKDRFGRKNGEGSFEKLKGMLEDPLLTLNDTGEYFGFTREMARQYFKKIYGFSYTECRGRKENRVRFYRGRTYGIYVEGMRILKAAGLRPRLVTRKSTYRILIGEYRIAARKLYLMIPDKDKPNRYFFTTSRKNTKADFFFCYIQGGRKFLIPDREMPGGLSIPVETTKSKYDKYKDAWGLLDNPCEVPIL